MGKKKGVVSVWSNSPYQPTGYGVQAGYLVEGLLQEGYAVSAISNFGVEGNNTTLKTPYGEIPHYARGFDPYSNDVGPMNHSHWLAQNPNMKDLLITLYDVWVLKGEAWGRLNNIASWTPLDHVTMPPRVEAWLRKPNVTPIAMSPHGVRQMNERDIENVYIPHAIDGKALKPVYEINGRSTRELLGFKDDDFVVGMVAANKASGMIHRKAFSENFLAFANFKKTHPDAKLYVHTDPFGAAGGWNLFHLLDSLGIAQEDVRFPSLVDYRYGLDQQMLAAFMTAMDVMLAPSYGEGFGVPTVEAQACGTRVIGSNWAATPDLLADDCFLVEGQPQWDSGQDAWWSVPIVSSIVDALNRAYDAPRGRSQVCIDFAQQFDVENVWKSHWKPYLDSVFDK
jgi:glycosyltransferase involved in cell wall biosynthesis